MQPPLSICLCAPLRAWHRLVLASHEAKLPQRPSRRLEGQRPREKIGWLPSGQFLLVSTLAVRRARSASSALCVGLRCVGSVGCTAGVGGASPRRRSVPEPSDPQQGACVLEGFRLRRCDARLYTEHWEDSSSGGLRPGWWCVRPVKALALQACWQRVHLPCLREGMHFPACELAAFVGLCPTGCRSTCEHCR
jgi:hypothetical protein